MRAFGALMSAAVRVALLRAATIPLAARPNLGRFGASLGRFFTSWSFAAVGWSFAAVGWSFAAVGWSFAAVGWSFAAVGWSFAAVCYSFAATSCHFADYFAATEQFWAQIVHFGTILANAAAQKTAFLGLFTAFDWRLMAFYLRLVYIVFSRLATKNPLSKF